MSPSMNDLSLNIHGQTIPGQQLHEVLSRLYPKAFTRDNFEREFQSCCLNKPHDRDTIRRVMQHLKRRQQIEYDPVGKTWSFHNNAVFDHEVTKTLPLPAIKKSTPKEPKPTFGNRFIAWVQQLILHLACLSSVLALMALNASFAYGLAENGFFQIAFVTGLMASDLMRPLLIATGLKSLAQKHFGRGMLAVLVALFLAPVSVLSSTTVISAALSLGAQANEQQATRASTRQTLQAEYLRLKLQADQEWHLRKMECQKGGCGKRAKKHATNARNLETDMKALLPKIVVLTKTSQHKSSFVSRSVKAFERMHIYGKGRELLIPVLLALTLEIAALFGPGLLLGTSKTKT